MNYIENIYLCLAAPIIVAIFCVRSFPRRSLGFILSGMTACLFSSYISTFFAQMTGATPLEASLEISPLIEEALKLTPVAFYVMVYEPKRNDAASEALMVAVGFATLENASFLLSSGADNTLHLMIRGFSTGAMHVACGAITAVVLRGLWDTLYFRIIATLGVLCLSVTCHGIYNILVNQPNAAAWVGYMLPLLIGAGAIIARKKLYGGAPEYGPPREGLRGIQSTKEEQ